MAKAVEGKCQGLAYLGAAVAKTADESAKILAFSPALTNRSHPIRLACRPPPCRQLKSLIITYVLHRYVAEYA